MRGPKPDRQRQLRPVHHRPGRYRRLATAVEAFVGVHPAPQERRASGTTGRTDKPLRPTPLEQERRTARLVRKVRLKLSQRSRPRHPVPPRARRRSPAHGTLILHIDQPGTAGWFVLITHALPQSSSYLTMIKFLWAKHLRICKNIQCRGHRVRGQLDFLYSAL